MGAGTVRHKDGNGKSNVFLRCHRGSSMFRPMDQPASTRIVFCTCPDPETARRIARTVVERRAAACASLVPGLTSVYRWQEQIETTAETLLMIKTTDAGYGLLEKTIRELHPYEVPEILAVDATNGLPAYLQWVESCVSS